MQYRTVSILIVLLGIQLIPTWAIDCYSCSGGPGSGCYDTFKSNGIPTVASTTGWCVKSKSEALGVKSIGRAPYANDPLFSCTKVGCEKLNIPIVGSVLNCCCNTNLCNSTGRLTSTMTVGIILSTLVFAFKKLMY